MVGPSAAPTCQTLGQDRSGWRTWLDHDPNGVTMMGTANPRRWDGDERGTGLGDGLAGADGPRALLAAMAAPGWITEEPDAHLLPHLRRACAESGSPWTLEREALDEAGVYRVDLTWTRPNGSMRSLTADLFALVGTIAENQTHV